MLFSVAIVSVLLLDGCGTTEIDLVGTWRSYDPVVPPAEPVVYRVGRITFFDNGIVVHCRNVLDAPDQTETNRYAVQRRKLILNPKDPEKRGEYKLTRKKDEIFLMGQYDLMPMRLKKEKTQQPDRAVTQESAPSAAP